VAGTVHYRLKAGEFVNPGTLVARVGAVEVRAPLPGQVRELSRAEGAQVAPGDALAELAADQNHVWEALRALYSVGEREDLGQVEPFARGVAGMPERLHEQALLTMQAIRARHP
jgi:pyruvate/2-oxoglutarate dehydrogenase complex dihydrolipoamide acyltransferase (E2) component